MAFEALCERIKELNNPSVMGLDPKLEYIPEFIRNGKSISDAIFEFNCGLIDSVSDIIPAVKPQSAFYEMYGLEGLAALDRTIGYAKEAGMYVILDAKRGDIGSTAEAYAEAVFGKYSAGADSVTVNPYLGYDGIDPFLKKAEQTGKTVFILAKTSNPSSSDFQNLDCGGEPLYRRVAKKIEEWGFRDIGSGGFSRCGAVVGATYPKQLAELRSEMRHTFFLVPGYGAQGGTADDVACAFSYGKPAMGAIVNSSRGLMRAYMKHGDDKNYKTYTREAAIAMKNDLNNATERYFI